MSVKSVLKAFFETDDVPTEVQYADLIDSNLNTDETSDQTVASNVEFTKNALASKLAANVANILNELDIGGGAAIGSGYAGIQTAPTDGMIIEGNVGINKTIPAVALDIDGALTATGSIIGGLFRTDSMDIDSDGLGGIIRTNSNRILITADNDGGGSGVIQLKTSNSDAIYIDGSQNTGFGTITPQTKLHVDGAITQNALSADPADPANNSSVKWQSDGTGSGADGDIMMKITDSGGTTKLVTLVDFSAI